MIKKLTTILLLATTILAGCDGYPDIKEPPKSTIGFTKNTAELFYIRKALEEISQTLKKMYFVMPK